MEHRCDFGRLITPDTKLQRQYFKQMVDLIGVYALFESPIHKDYTQQGELLSKYNSPVRVGCIFSDHIDQTTAKKLGWDAELDGKAVINVPYDLDGLEVGSLFTIPSAFDNTPGRKFRVIKLSTIQIYPASIACELVPEYEDIYSNVIYKNDSLTLLTEEEEPNMINPNLDTSEMFDWKWKLY